MIFTVNGWSATAQRWWIAKPRFRRYTSSRMAVYHRLKAAYRALLPRRLRTFLWTNPITRRPREWLLRRVEKLAAHQELYDRDYYLNTVDPAAARSAPIMAGRMNEVLHPATVVDVGCGTGQMMLSFQKRGASCR